jgi:hypothetical protein
MSWCPKLAQKGFYRLVRMQSAPRWPRVSASERHSVERSQPHCAVVPRAGRAPTPSRRFRSGFLNLAKVIFSSTSLIERLASQWAACCVRHNLKSRRTEPTFSAPKGSRGCAAPSWPCGRHCHGAEGRRGAERAVSLPCPGRSGPCSGSSGGCSGSSGGCSGSFGPCSGSSGPYSGSSGGRSGSSGGRTANAVIWQFRMVFRQFRRASGIRCDMAVPDGVPAVPEGERHKM